MVNKTLVEKINKILALTHSPNENEAAIAAEKVAQLLAQYNLSLTDLDTHVCETKNSNNEKIADDVVEETRRYITWKMLILAGIASANGCEALRHKYTGKMRLVGQQTSLIVSHHLYDYLVSTVERLAKHQKGKGHAFIHGFKVGCATRLRQRLELLRREMEENGLSGNGNIPATPAIVVRSMFEKNQMAIAAYLEAEGIKIKIKNSCQVSSHSGFHSGYMAGDQISLNQQVKSGSAMQQLPDSKCPVFL